MKLHAKRFLKAFLLFTILNAAAAAVSMLIPYRVGYCRSDSIRCKLVVWRPVDSYVPARGDLVIFKPRDYGPLARQVQGTLLVKWVRGVPGDFLACGPPLGCFVNGRRAGAPPPPDKTDSELIFEGYIPDGFFAPFGDVERSYDTRFAGLVPVEDVVGVGELCLPWF